ncbi:RHS repeat-associated core domain-containing protein [Haloferula chungangensis]|uniref:RHS repeat-associated core domain-containing protein n=1 Tax=Haloferula chungangensis TaxID=1048331 RepID=A0ABW2LFF9_9BACT
MNKKAMTLLAACFGLLFQTLGKANENNPPIDRCCTCYTLEILPDNKLPAGQRDLARVEALVDSTGQAKIRIKLTKAGIDDTQGGDACDDATYSFTITSEGKEVASGSTSESKEFEVSLDALDGEYVFEGFCNNSDSGSGGSGDGGLCDREYIFVGSCESCGLGGADSCDATGSARVTVGLGVSYQGDTKASLVYYTESLTNPGVSALGLMGVDGMTVTKDGNGHLQSVETETVKAVVSAVSSAHDAKAFKVEFMHNTGAGDGTLFRTMTVENVVTAGVTSLKVTHDVLTKSTVTEYKEPTPDKWVMTTGNGLRRETKLVSLDDGATRVQRITVEERKSDGIAYEVVSDKEEIYTYYPWGDELTSVVQDPDGAKLTTTWSYYELGEETGPNGTKEGYARLKQMTRYDGYEELHTYEPDKHTIVTPFAGDVDGLTKVIEWDSASNARTTTSKVGANVLSKVVEIKGTDTRTRRVYTDDTNYLETVTEYYSLGAPFGRQPKKVTNPDGTVRIYSYSRISGSKVTNIYDGAANGAGTGLVEGTKTVRTENAFGNLESEVVTSVSGNSAQDQLTLHEQTTTSFDNFGRPTAVGYFFDGSGGFAYTTSASYYCCGLESETDMYGITTRYAHDDLRRVVKSNRLNVTHEVVYNGLTQSTHRYSEASTGFSSTTSFASATNEVSRSVVSNLAGTATESWSREAKNGGMVKTASVTTYQPGVGLSRKVVVSPPQTADDSAQPTQTTEYFLDGTTYQTGGDLAPSMRYSYAVGTAGLETDRSYVDGTSLREKVRTKSDYAGRKTDIVYAPGTSVGGTASSFYNSLGQLVRSVDPDGVTTLFAYNDEGERTAAAIDLDDDDTIDVGVDTVTNTETYPVSAHGETVMRTVTSVWSDDETPVETVLSHQDRAVTGLGSWSISYPGSTSEESSSVTELGTAGAGSWTVTQSDPTGAFTETSYTGGLTATIARFKLGGTTAIATTTYTTYDSQNRPTHVTDRTGTTITAYVNDSVDAVKSVTLPGSRTTSYTYDLRNRLTLTDSPNTEDEDGEDLANETATTYFSHGGIKEISGGQTYRRTYTYDYAQRQATMTTYGTSSATTEWQYDLNRGWLDRKEYSGGKGTDYTYTAAGRLETREWSRDIDGGNPATSSKARLKAAYTYYPGSGRLETVAYNDGTPGLEYGYTHNGQIDWVEQGGVRTHDYAYRADLLLDTETVAYDLNGDDDTEDAGDLVRVIERNYEDGSGSTIHRRPSGFVLHDGAVTPTVDHSVGYHYEADIDRLQGISASGVPNLSGKLYAFDYSYNVSNSAHLIGTVTSPVHTVNNTWFPDRDVLALKENKDNGLILVSSFDYDFSVNSTNYSVNDIGQRTGVETAGSAFGVSPPTHLWGYNSRGEVVSADSNKVSSEDRYFTYDGIGNRTQSRVGTALSSGGTAINYMPNSLNQYGTIGSASPQHDLDGNLTEGGLRSAALTSAVGTAYTGTLIWNAENRLIEVKDGSTTKARFTYDYQGRRISKTVGSATTWYLYDGWNVIAEYAGTALNRTYVWGMDLSGSMQGAGGVGGLLAMIDESATGDPVYYPTYDGNGNVSEYLQYVDDADPGTSGNQPGVAVQSHFEYDPFGNLLVSTDTTGFFRYRFSTKPLDSETGLLYYGFRHYDPVTGRWPSRDPIGEPGFISIGNTLSGELAELAATDEELDNLYRFSLNDPVNLYDVLGLKTAAECEREFEACNDGCRALPGRRTVKKALCFSKCQIAYGACLAATEEAIVCYCVVGAGAAIVVATATTGPAGGVVVACAIGAGS